MLNIDNIEELQSLLENIKNKHIDFSTLELNFFQNIKIKIKGNPKRYNGTITYSICRGLCEFQNELWKTYAEIKSGTSDIRKLTQTEKDALEIVFEVNEGCTEIIAKATDFITALKGLVKEATNGMNGQQKAATVIATAIVLSLGGGWWVYSDNQKEIELANIDLQKQAAVFDTIKNIAEQSNNTCFQNAIHSIETHAQKGYGEIIRSVSDADEIIISTVQNENKITLPKQEMTKIVETIDAQDKAITKPEELEVYIDGVKRSNNKVTIYIRTTQNEEFSANVDTDMLGEHGVNQIIDRIKDYNTIRLSGMVKRRVGNIERATITEIVTPE
ncbi:hypothetical protein FHQ28_05400 [Pasteurellaceae bacterium USgator11]|nr:hypothetical protein FHQ19_09395 [Pasteurellaceae bacterium UScroc12]TNG94751.1 hypothetical protein FHQ20_08140 [Pasteurellaceae bacterium USgator41]TNG97722.1 hypothetical protein FHQ24_09930 [Pasteurellaceae bacterium UScroc31]TNH01683.1 hypothetical protein FHQ28_05400 [Pasteurellaceae bacterium USgator11]